MKGCFKMLKKTVDADRELPPKMDLASDPRAICGFIDVKESGQWRRRVAVITDCGILVIYTSLRLGRTYKLVDPSKLQLTKKKDDRIYIKLTTCANRRVELCLSGEEIVAWAARIVQPTGMRLCHPTHETTALPVTTTERYSSASELHFSSDSSLNEEDRFSFSIPLNSSNDSIPQVLFEDRELAGWVHSIMTDTSMSMAERKERIVSLTGSKRKQKKIRDSISNSEGTGGFEGEQVGETTL